MSDLQISAADLRVAAGAISNKAADIPLDVPLSLDSISARAVTAAAENFNLWYRYSALVAAARTRSAAASAMDAAAILEEAEQTLADGAV